MHTKKEPLALFIIVLISRLKDFNNLNKVAFMETDSVIDVWQRFNQIIKFLVLANGIS